MPGRKRYTPVVSGAQRRKLFAMAGRGEMPLHEAKGKARAAKGRRLPDRVGRTRSRSRSRR